MKRYSIQSNISVDLIVVMVRDLKRLGERALEYGTVMDAWVTLKLGEYRIMESYIQGG